eukprot:Gb_22225 [translate_table: standard]
MYSRAHQIFHKHLLQSISNIFSFHRYQIQSPWQLQHLQPFSQRIGGTQMKVRTRDHAFDDYMEVCKKVRKVLKFQDIILAQPDQSICVARLDTLSRRLGMKMYEAGSFVLKFPHIFEIFEHPVQRLLWCRLTRNAMNQIQEEKAALLEQEDKAVLRLRKILMMASGGRVRLEHIRIAREDLGLPEDLEFSIILKYPQYFRLVDANENRMKYVEIVERDHHLSVCAIERAREQEYRERGKNEENIRFSFIINFPPGFKISKYYRIAVWKWQKLPYWSPYEDISRHDLRSLEAQRRLEKRAVASIHELLSLTVEKKMSLERIAHFRQALNLPNKLKKFLLYHQGIFYSSTRGNQGKLHTIFLREAYKKGELIEPNSVYLARRRLVQLILLSPRKATYDESLAHYKKDRDDEKATREYIESSYKIESNLPKEGSFIGPEDDAGPGEISPAFEGDAGFDDMESDVSFGEDMKMKFCDRPREDI